MDTITVCASAVSRTIPSSREQGGASRRARLPPAEADVEAVSIGDEVSPTNIYVYSTPAREAAAATHPRGLAHLDQLREGPVSLDVRGHQHPRHQGQDQRSTADGHRRAARGRTSRGPADS